ncbi:MAG: 50S ribosomal protein L11 methyltransferase [Verrucomicrobia bacterium]|nr:MAG: 50S ribosomal protein L11 methyltransferase [Verrucomicrobiota bacterium]
MAKIDSITQLSVTTTQEAEDAVAALLERFLGQTPAVYTDADTGISVVTGYSKKPPALLKKIQTCVAEGLQHLATCGLSVGESAVVMKKVPREDWAESWKKFFKPIEIGKVLLVKPSWSRQKAKSKQAVMILDPGLSFGTGQHPTTHFCLTQLAALREVGGSFLDMGTGTGILAIAAVKLGYKPVKGFDFDPVAVRVAKENAHRNRVGERLSFTRQDLTKLPNRTRRRVDLICANLMADLLIGYSSSIVNRLRPGGHIVLAGILISQFAAVQLAFEKQGCRLITSQAENEWQSGLFELRRG